MGVIMTVDERSGSQWRNAINVPIVILHNPSLYLATSTNISADDQNYKTTKKTRDDVL